jgi:hypothetical protein
MDPGQAIQILQQFGITEAAFPLLAQAVDTIKMALTGGGGGGGGPPPAGAGGPPVSPM